MILIRFGKIHGNQMACCAPRFSCWKPSSIDHVKIGDLGLATYAPGGGSPGYMAPEMNTSGIDKLKHQVSDHSEPHALFGAYRLELSSAATELS